MASAGHLELSTDRFWAVFTFLFDRVIIFAVTVRLNLATAEKIIGEILRAVGRRRSAVGGQIDPGVFPLTSMAR